MLHVLKNLDHRFILTPKILYFFINLQFFTLHQFRTNFAMQSFGISEGTYGMIAGLCLFVTFFSNIGLATTNDRLNKQKYFLAFLILLNMFVFQGFFFIGKSANLFWGVFILYIITNNSVPPLLDKLTIEYLSKIPGVGPQTYGRQRLWGTIGYVVANWIIEAIVKRKSDDPTEKILEFDNLRFYNVITSVIVLSLIAVLIHASSRASVRHDIFASWQSLLGNRAYFFFIFIILLNGITRGSMTFYLTTYLTNVVGLESYDIPDSVPKFFAWPLEILNKSPIATSSMFGVLFEIIILYNAKIITGAIGLYWPLLLAQVAQVFRFIGYLNLNTGATHRFPYVCCLELMKGMNFGLTHISAVQIATSLCPVHLKTTSQTIYSGAFTGLSGVFAGWIFGSIMKGVKDKKGRSNAEPTYRLFFYVNIFITLFCILLFIYRYWFVERVLSFTRSQETPQKVPEEESSEEEVALEEINNEKSSGINNENNRRIKRETEV